MADGTVDALVLDLLEWIGPSPRPCDEVLEAWRTSCPRLPVWEEANDRGFLTRHPGSGGGGLVSVSPVGWDHLRMQRSARVGQAAPVRVSAGRPAPGHNRSSALWDQFLWRSRLRNPDLRSIVLALSRIPYGRPSAPSAQLVVSEWRGTCSTKHMLLEALVHEHWPTADIELWHRVYSLTPELAGAKWGSEVAATVPPDGLVDVHTFARARLVEEPISLDVTFPVADWDGRSPMEIASGPGEDHRAGADPVASKRELVARFCDPCQREPFIEALTTWHRDEALR